MLPNFGFVGFVIRVFLRTRSLPVSIVEGQCSGKAGCRHAGLDCGGNNVAPGRLSAVDGIPEEVVQQEVCLQKKQEIQIFSSGCTILIGFTLILKIS